MTNLYFLLRAQPGEPSARPFGYILRAGFFSLGMTPFCHTVGNVVLMRAEPQVAWPHTTAISQVADGVVDITLVEHAHAFWYLSEHKRIGGTMGTDSPTVVILNPAVAIRHTVACPQPTAVRLFHSFPQTINKGTALFLHARDAAKDAFPALNIGGPDPEGVPTGGTDAEYVTLTTHTNSLSVRVPGAGRSNAAAPPYFSTTIPHKPTVSPHSVPNFRKGRVSCL